MNKQKLDSVSLSQDFSTWLTYLSNTKCLITSHSTRVSVIRILIIVIIFYFIYNWVMHLVFYDFVTYHWPCFFLCLWILNNWNKGIARRTQLCQWKVASPFYDFYTQICFNGQSSAIFYINLLNLLNWGIYIFCQLMF